MTTDSPVYNHSAHKALWLWLSENPYLWKADWPGWEHHQNLPARLCFACQYTVDVFRNFGFKNSIGCELCPLDWPGKRCTFRNSTGLYDLWSESSPISHVRSKLARDIADLPVKDGVIYI